MQECESQIELPNLKLGGMNENENGEGPQFFLSKLERTFPFVVYFTTSKVHDTGTSNSLGDHKGT